MIWILILLLVCILFMAPRHEGLQTEWKEELATVYRGTEVGYGSGSVEDAKSACKETPSCVGFMHSPSVQKYVLNSTMNSDEAHVSINSYKMQSRAERRPTAPTGFSWVYKPYTTYVNAQANNNGTVADAKVKCNATPGCAGISYSASGDGYAFASALDELQYSPTHHVYVLEKNPVSVKPWTTEDNTNYPGNDIKCYSDGSPPEAAQSACKYTPSCVGVAITPSGQACLKTKLERKESAKNWTVFSPPKEVVPLEAFTNALHEMSDYVKPNINIKGQPSLTLTNVLSYMKTQSFHSGGSGTNLDSLYS